MSKQSCCCSTGLLGPTSSSYSKCLPFGAHAKTEFYDWLQADHSQSHWVLALEPDPDLAKAHLEHPQLAVLEAGSLRSLNIGPDNCGSL